ncbi:MAG TPA: hypothetical protein VFY12_08525 [Arenimonas sp.]|nr:hypothetical protein [Arenimonas sp.]
MSFLTWLGFKPTAADLAHAMLKQLRRLGHSDWHYLAASNELRNDRDAVVHLGNLALEYRQAPRGQRRALVEKYCSIADGLAKEVPKLWTMAQGAIYPILRSRWDQPLFALHVRAQGHAPRSYSSRPLADSLCIRLVYDFGAGLAHIDDELIDTWGQSFESALEAAVANLRALESPRWHAVDDGVYQLQSDVSYEESFVLLDRVRAALPFADSAVFIACNRGVLLAASGADDAALLRMIALAEQSLHERPWPQSPELITQGDNGWQTFAAEGEAAMRAQELMTQDRARIYDEQKYALEQIHEATEEDVFVASCSLLRRDQDAGALRSWSTWSDGVLTLLPQSDLVALARNLDRDGDPDVLFVSWDKLQQVCAARLTAEPLDPPRYRTDGFPSQEEWERLAERV